MIASCLTLTAVIWICRLYLLWFVFATFTLYGLGVTVRKLTGTSSYALENIWKLPKYLSFKAYLEMISGVLHIIFVAIALTFGLISFFIRLT